MFVVFFLGLCQYFSRNVLTAFKYSDQLEKTQIFLSTNLNNIKIFPGFAFLLSRDLSFVSLGNNTIEVQKPYMKVYAINGLKIPCDIDNHPNNKFQPIKIFSKKFFNSNSGYGIWICQE